MSVGKLIKVLQFSDSVLPVGGFAFSNGLESAIQERIVCNAATLEEFTRTALKQAATGDGRAVFSTCKALVNNDQNQVIQNDIAVFNRRLNEEGRLMIIRMGKKLAEMAAEITSDPTIIWWLDRIKSNDTSGTYPITQAVVMTSLGVSPEEVITMHLYGTAMTILNAAIRLMRITHIETQRILFNLQKDIELFSKEAEVGGVKQMSSYAPVTDILASIHVGSYTRLFAN